MMQRTRSSVCARAVRCSSAARSAIRAAPARLPHGCSPPAARPLSTPRSRAFAQRASTWCSTPVMPRSWRRSQARCRIDMAAEALEQDDAQRLRICADALRSARSMLALSTGLSIVAAVGVTVAAMIAGTLAITVWSAALAIGVVAQWVGFRLAFDARLLARVPADKAGRNVDAPCRGALAPLRGLGIVVVVHAVVIVAAGVALRAAWT